MKKDKNRMSVMQIMSFDKKNKEIDVVVKRCNVVS